MGRADRIVELLDEGLSGAEIARRLGVSHSTVSRTAARLGRPLGRARGSKIDWLKIRASYEAGRTIAECCREFGLSRGAWDRAVTRGDLVPRPPSVPPPSVTRRAVGEMLDRGFSQAAMARELGLSKATIAHHVRGLGIRPDVRFSRRYDWTAVQLAHDSGLSASECCLRFGFTKGTWSKAVKTGRIKARSRLIPLEKLLVRGRPTSRGHLKARLIAGGLKEKRCEQCGLDEWMGQPLNPQLHHKNGDATDNRLENLEFLCANCHSQTDTYGGRNGHRRPEPDLKLIEGGGEVDEEDAA